MMYGIFHDKSFYPKKYYIVENPLLDQFYKIF